MCQWHMFSRDRSGEVGVRSAKQSAGIKVGDFRPDIISLKEDFIYESTVGLQYYAPGDCRGIA